MNWYHKHMQGRDAMVRIADFITDQIGSPASLFVHTVWFLIWFDAHLDVGLLTNLVSLEAIYLAVFIQLSLNNQKHLHRHHAEADRYLLEMVKPPIIVKEVGITRRRRKKK